MLESMCVGLLSWIIMFSSYENPNECPEIIVLPQEELAETVCEGKCAARAYYTYEDHIYISDQLALDRAAGRGVILHELVHWLQMRENGLSFESSCEEKTMAELEARRIQSQYVEAYGQLLGSMPRHGC